MKNKGITLIALIVTVIVLLIIAGVSIGALTGDEGIIGQTKEARVNTQRNDIQEQIELMIIKATDEFGEIDKANLLERLNTLPEEKEIVDNVYEIHVIYPEFAFEIELSTGDIYYLKERLEMVVATTNKRVVLPIDNKYNCRIDWGDGCVTVNEGETASKEELKIASTEEGIKVAASDTPIGISHIYGKNGEYTVKIKGEEVYEIYNCEAYESGDYYTDSAWYYSKDNLLEIKNWGEVGLKRINLYDNYKLTKIASPGENSFNNLEYCGFEECIALTEIPSDLFKNASKLVSLTYTFAGCTSLTKIPSDLFNNIPEVEKVDGFFADCTGLTEIPSDLFKNTFKLESVRSVFSGCTGLTEIPSDLFKNTSKLRYLEYVFANCTGLTEIPRNLFENNPQITSLFGAFSGCTGLTGTAPEMWKLGSNNEENGYQGMPNGYNCFAGCTGLDNYDDIPEFWK